ncbi:MAG TPA: hypothetical protein VM889_12680 [Candidatus Thermoplasmatota archaeon]|nr:hypothetical protein [Candidatus Thermoplasmatota archaeon]
MALIPMSHQAWSVLSGLLILLGVAFYLWVGLVHGSWTDIGSYTIAVTLIGFGAVGLWTARAPPAGTR